MKSLSVVFLACCLVGCGQLARLQGPTPPPPSPQPVACVAEEEEMILDRLNKVVAMEERLEKLEIRVSQTNAYRTPIGDKVLNSEARISELEHTVEVQTKTIGNLVEGYGKLLGEKPRDVKVRYIVTATLPNSEIKERTWLSNDAPVPVDDAGTYAFHEYETNAHITQFGSYSAIIKRFDVVTGEAIEARLGVPLNQ